VFKKSKRENNQCQWQQQNVKIIVPGIEYVDKAALDWENYPDGSSMDGETSFIKQWRIKNTGTSSWNDQYCFKNVTKTLSIDDSPHCINGNVLPGQVYTFEIDMKTPSAQAEKQSLTDIWKFVDPQEQTISIGNSTTLWAKIDVKPVSNPDDGCNEPLNFDNGIIIPDNEVLFIEIPIPAIQAFLEEKGSILANIDLSEYHLDPVQMERNNQSWSDFIGNDWVLDELKNNKPAEQKYSPAKIIYLAAKENNVNPVILLSYLQKEQGLISRTSSSNLQHILNRSVGYMMRESGDNPKYYGFLAQLTGLSFEIALELPKFEGNYGKWIDGTYVQIKSGFAHFHYDYTPHIQSGSTLFNVYESYRQFFIQKGYMGCMSDNDSDGMPDSWEIIHHLDPDNNSDALTDKDNDGIINLIEYQNNTNPEIVDYYHINGTVQYMGNSTGQIYVIAYNKSSHITPICEQVHDMTEGHHTIQFSLVVPNGNYMLESFLDVNDNTIHDNDEPKRQYAQTITISNGNDTLLRTLTLDSVERLHGDLDNNGVVEIEDVRRAFFIYLGNDFADTSLLDIIKCPDSTGSEITIEDVRCVFFDYLGQ
jgi:hypothetical protein